MILSVIFVRFGYQAKELKLTVTDFLCIATEWIGVSRRSWGACVTQLFGAVGQIVLAGMIYFIRDWRLAQLVTAAPHAVIAIYIWCALSPFITLEL